MTITVARYTDSGAPVIAQATGSLIAVFDWFLVTQMGWTKAVLGTNQASYRAPTGNRFYLQVDDTNTAYARVSGWETLTALNTGTNQWPSSAQVAGGLYVNKVAGMPYRCFSNGRMFWFVSYPNAYSHFLGFGDFLSFKSGDAYNSFITADTSSNTTVPAALFSQAASNTGFWLCRTAAQTGTSTQAGPMGDLIVSGGGVAGGSSAAGQYPSPLDGSMHISPMFIIDNAVKAVRGTCPGIWFPLHYRPFTDSARFTIPAGAGPLAGRSFDVADQTGQIFIETTDNWMTALP